MRVFRWPKDPRVVEARRVLQSCKPVVVSVEQGPEVNTAIPLSLALGPETGRNGAVFGIKSAPSLNK